MSCYRMHVVVQRRNQIACDQQAFLLGVSGSLLHVDSVLDDTTKDFMTRFSEEMEGRKCGGEREHTAAFMCEDSDMALSWRAAIAEL